MSIQFGRAHAIYRAETFTMPPVIRFLHAVLPPGLILDPFAGSGHLREIAVTHADTRVVDNDLDPTTPADLHIDALEFLSRFPDQGADCIVLDPPRTLSEWAAMRRTLGLPPLRGATLKVQLNAVRREAARVLRPGGTAISFGHSSVGLGSGLGFAAHGILLVPHLAHIPDTICVAETKKGGTPPSNLQQS